MLSINKRLSDIENTLNKKTIDMGKLFIFIKDVSDQKYKISDLSEFSKIKDADKLRFTGEQDITEFLIKNADLLDTTENYILKYKPILIDIKDNSHLESALYNANKSSKGG